MISHISFDLWNTLIWPNKSYAVARNWTIADTLKISYDEVAEQYSKTKNLLDKYPYGYPTRTCWNQLFQDLYVNSIVCSSIPESTRQAIVDKCQRLFLEYPPILESVSYFSDCLSRLADQNITFNIASNTNFISGNIINQVLDQSVNKHLNFHIFSDQFGFSKPHPKFFQLIQEKSEKPFNQILHIGDTPAADGAAVVHGMKFHLVSNPQETLKYLQKLIK